MQGTDIAFLKKKKAREHNIPDSGYHCWEGRWVKISMNNPLILMLGGFAGVQFIITLHNPHALYVPNICVHQISYNINHSVISTYINIP